MISNDKLKYESSFDWLLRLREDELWSNEEKRLQAADSSALASLKSEAIEELRDKDLHKCDLLYYWERYNHDVEKAVCEVWELHKTLEKLKRQTIAILTLEWMKHHACGSQDVPEKLRLNGTEQATDAASATVPKMKTCVLQLKEEKVLKHLYDYTWVMEVMNQTKGLPHFNTPGSFIAFLRDMGVERLPSVDSINRKQNTFSGEFPDLVYS